MSTIPAYPPCARPLDGNEPLAGWQDGAQRAIPASLIAQLAIDALQAIAQASADRTWISVADFGERGAIPTETLTFGRHVYVTSSDQLFRWTHNAPVDPAAPDGPVADGWVDVSTKYELNGLRSAVGSLTSALASTAAGIGTGDAILQGEIVTLADLQIVDFKASSLAPDGPVDVSWGLRGLLPAVQTLEWAGWPVVLDPLARSLTLPASYTQAPTLLVIGDSQSDSVSAQGTWPALLAASRGVPLITVAKYSAGSKQVYRCGAKPILLTLAGNVLPVGGTTVAVTAINGAAPGVDNPASLLFTYPGDNAANAFNQITGMLAGRHVTLSAASGGSGSYSVVADAGLGATDVPPGSLFVPDFAASMGVAELLFMQSVNYFYSGVASDHINPIALADLDLMVRMNRGQAVNIVGLTPDASWVPGTLQHTALRAFNAALRDRYPLYYVVDALGRDSLARLLASGDGSAGDNADIANGVVPRSLRLPGDTLHLNAAGNAIIAQLVEDWWAIRPLRPAISGTTRFTLSVSGQDGIGNALADQAVALIQPSSDAALLANLAARIAVLEARP